jgi:23S rRNA (uracil1939-C5)-methyltransferase
MASDTPNATLDPVPSCRHFPRCGGCTHLDRSYAVELAQKEAEVRSLLVPAGFAMDPILGSPREEGWRHKVQLPFGIRKEGRRLVPTLGCYARDSHDVVDQSECRIQDPALTRVAQAVREWASREGIPVYDERNGSGFLRHVLLRKAQATGEILVGLVCNGRRPPHYRALLKPLLERLSRALPGDDGKLVGVVQDVNLRDTNVVLGGLEEAWWGRNWIKERLGEQTYHLELSTFFQVNPYQTPHLYDLVRDAVPDRARLLDAYCGLGTIGAWCSGKAREVLGLEENPASIRAARAAAKANGLANFRFVQGDAAQRIPELAHQGWDAVVLDPPRKGLDPASLEALGNARIPRLVYVSCDPRSLRRDTEALAGAYRPVRARPVDMFPRTSHVETVAVFDRI